jgi:5-methylcytosine-specific restriction endonuclease McrA
LIFFAAGATLDAGTDAQRKYPFMSRALVLNASFEPLAVVSVRRAAVLVWDDKAEVLEHNGEMGTTSGALLAPTVVRLRRYVKIPYRRSLRRPTLVGLVARDGRHCAYCVKRTASTIDHIVPKGQGGEHTWMNTCAACQPCNNKKGWRTPEEAGMTLHVTPREPSKETWLVVFTRRDPSWETYLAPFDSTLFASAPTLEVASA